jgi:sugar/nucleoside kinase (ribokinase family)
MGLECLTCGILVADHLCAPIPRVPEAGELILSDELPLRLGGCAANAATDLARLGVRVGAVGCVGGDPFGRFVIESLDQAGVETSGIRQRDDVGTSGTLIINVAGQDRRFIHALGANARFEVADIPADRVRQAKVFYVGGYLLMPALEPHGLAKLFCTAQQAGVITVLDVVLPGAGDHWPALEPLLPYVDVFLPNDDEAEALTGLSDPLAQAERFLQAGVRTAVITCGQEGTVLASRQLRLRAGIYPVRYVGGTGAGDAFDAGYIAGLLAGEDPTGCLRWGSALGASCVRSVGATDSVFTRPEAIDFMGRYELPIERA